MIVDLHLESRSILIVGGGQQATRKAKVMLKEGGLITVVSPQFSVALEEMAGDKRLKIIQQLASDDDALLEETHPDILVAATDDIALNMRLVELAKRRGILAYNASSPRNSDYSHVAVAEVGDIIKVGISTGGNSPVMAKAIRDAIRIMLKRLVTENRMKQLKDEGEWRDLRRDCVEMVFPQGKP